MVIFDEAARVDDDLLAALRPTMATVDGTLIMLTTPFGKRGEFYRAWTEGQGWTKVRVPAAMCPRLSRNSLPMSSASSGLSLLRGIRAGIPRE